MSAREKICAHIERHIGKVERDINDVVDPHRKNVGKRFLGLF